MPQWGLLLDGPMWGSSTFYVWETSCAEIQCVDLKTNRERVKHSNHNWMSTVEIKHAKIECMLCVLTVLHVFCFTSSANSHTPWLVLQTAINQSQINYTAFYGRCQVWPRKIMFPLYECMCVCLPWTRWSVFGVGQAQGAWTSGYTQVSLLFHHPGQQ